VCVILFPFFKRVAFLTITTYVLTLLANGYLLKSYQTKNKEDKLLIYRLNKLKTEP